MLFGTKDKSIQKVAWVRPKVARTLGAVAIGVTSMLQTLHSIKRGV